MEEHQASRTALGAAVLRAAHQLLDQPLVFADSLAVTIVQSEVTAALSGTPEGIRTTARTAQRAGIAARSRFAEDELAKAVARGIRQYVLLGAGLDTFACRNPHAAAGLRVFEVDHPATQAWKRERLAVGGMSFLPGSVFAAVNFERQTLDEGLAAAGFAFDQPAFFSWLGVTTYLTKDAIRQTLRFVAARPAGSTVVFTYQTSPDKLGPAQRAAYEQRAAWVAAVGEPFRTFFDPDELASELRRLGFSQLEDLGPEAITARYFAGRSDDLRPGPSGHFMLAKV